MGRFQPPLRSAFDSRNPRAQLARDDVHPVAEVNGGRLRRRVAEAVLAGLEIRVRPVGIRGAERVHRAIGVLVVRVRALLEPGATEIGMGLAVVLKLLMHTVPRQRRGMRLVPRSTTRHSRTGQGTESFRTPGNE